MSTTPQAATESSSETAIQEFLASHPRMIGVLFMVLLVLAQAGQAAAANSSAIAGP